MISNLIYSFSETFLSEKKKTYRATDNTEIITQDIPSILKDRLDIGSNYKIYGSVGSGNWAEIPWIGILDRSITEFTSKGYYIVLLFDRSVRNIYLGLSVGWTQFQNEYGSDGGKRKMIQTCRYYAKSLKSRPPGFREGAINLEANNMLSKGYELGNIISKKYHIGKDFDGELFTDIKQLLRSYEELKNIVGDSILNVDIDSREYDNTFDSFKKEVAAASFDKNVEQSIRRLIEKANQSPLKVRKRLKREILRNRKFANFIKDQADYICQICGRHPFIQKNGNPYAEADHIVPLGGNKKGLDELENMRCLCAQCHAVVTYGSEEAVKSLSE